MGITLDTEIDPLALEFARPLELAPTLPIFVLNAPDLLPSLGADNLLQEVIFR
jgi:hypothetical protein